MKFFRVLIAVLTVTFIAADAMAITNAQKMQMHKERQKSKNQDCENSLYKLNSILRTYAAKNKGFLPNKNNFAGLKSLIAYGAKIEHFSCKAARTKKAKDLTRLSEESNPYLYFGGINLTQAAKSCPKLVVICDKPGSRHLNVLFADGSVGSIDLKKTTPRITCAQKLIDYLGKEYKYPAATLKVMQNKAKSIDQALGLNKR